MQGARALVERHDGKVEHVLDDDERVALLRCYGIEMLPFRRAHSAAEAVAVASELGFPVAIKATADRSGGTGWTARASG